MTFPPSPFVHTYRSNTSNNAGDTPPDDECELQTQYTRVHCVTVEIEHCRSGGFALVAEDSDDEMTEIKES